MNLHALLLLGVDAIGIRKHGCLEREVGIPIESLRLIGHAVWRVTRVVRRTVATSPGALRPHKVLHELVYNVTRLILSGHQWMINYDC